MENWKDQCGPEHGRSFHGHERWTGFTLRFLSTVGKETKQAQAYHSLSLEKKSGLSFETSVDSCIFRCLKWLLKTMHEGA